MIILGLTGLAGSGKSTVAEYLKKHGFRTFVFSDVIREDAEKLKLLENKTPEEQKTILSKLGIKLREESGNMGILADLLIKEIESQNLDKIIVDGFRSVDEVKKFREKHVNFYLILIDAKMEKRIKRLMDFDKKADEAMILARDKENIEKQGLGDVIKMADFKIINDSELENLYKQIDDMIEDFTG